MAAAEAPDLRFDTALLVGALDPRHGEDGLVEIMGAKGDEAVALLTSPAAEDPLDRRAEVVVADPPENAAEEAEGLDVAFEEGLLRLAREGRDEGGARVAGTEVEEVDLPPLAAQRDVCLAQSTSASADGRSGPNQMAELSKPPNKQHRQRDPLHPPGNPGSDRRLAPDPQPSPRYRPPAPATTTPAPSQPTCPASRNLAGRLVSGSL